MCKKLKTKILELRKQGYSYNEIQDSLGCSKSTISFHCGTGQKEKSKLRLKKLRKNNPLYVKINNFLRKSKIKENTLNPVSKNSFIKRLKIKTWTFVKNKKEGGYKKRMFTEQELIEKIGNNPVCYLTGRPININDSRSYALDHFISRSKGGDNSLENCEIACIEANQAKHTMSYEDFLQLCRDVVNNHERKTQ
jgi:5-methylcytosine-specific restriction endonuclease McrA